VIVKLPVLFTNPDPEENEISNPAGGTTVTLLDPPVPIILYDCTALGEAEVWEKGVNPVKTVKVALGPDEGVTSAHVLPTLIPSIVNCGA
jgi:hypothetical protein